MFSDKLPVDAGNVSVRVYQGDGVNSFQSMQGEDQLYRVFSSILGTRIQGQGRQSWLTVVKGF